MSLIFGINLSDRIFVSGDTRVSKIENDIIIETKDKVCKVVPFSPNIIAAFAGDAGLSAAIAKRLDLAMSVFNIRDFRSRAKEFIVPVVDRWWRDNNSKASVVIIFGGINPKKRKKIEAFQLDAKVKEYNKIKKSSNSMNLKPALFDVFERLSTGKPRYPEPPDSHVFAVRIFPPSGFEIDDAEWGEFLAYGPNGITRESLSPEIFGRSEFEGDGEMFHENLVLTGALQEIALKSNEPTIGDAFINGFVREGLLGVVGGSMYRIDTKTMESEKLPEVSMEGQKVIVKYSDGRKETLTYIKDFSSYGSLEI